MKMILTLLQLEIMKLLLKGSKLNKIDILFKKIDKNND
jgi:hypothetical protein